MKQKDPGQSLVDFIVTAESVHIFYYWVLMNIAFTCLYVFLSYTPGSGPTLPSTDSVPERILNALYFTLVTTFTIGYGDVVPQGLSKVLIMIQSLFAMILMVAFTTKILSKKQDEAIQTMHLLIDANTVRHIREELHLLRKDLDRIMKERTDHGVVQERNWELAEAAAYHALVLVDDIRDILKEMGMSPSITDRRREQVVFESMYRTVHRLDEFFAVNNTYSGTLSHAQASFLIAIKEFIEDVRDIARHWHLTSPYQQKTEYDERVIVLSERLLKHMEHVNVLTGGILRESPTKKRRPAHHSQNEKPMV